MLQKQNPTDIINSVTPAGNVKIHVVDRMVSYKCNKPLVHPASSAPLQARPGQLVDSVV